MDPTKKLSGIKLRNMFRVRKGIVPFRCLASIVNHVPAALVYLRHRPSPHSTLYQNVFGDDDPVVNELSCYGESRANVAIYRGRNVVVGEAQKVSNAAAVVYNRKQFPKNNSKIKKML